MDKKEIFIEESVLDDIAKGLDTVERPLDSKYFVMFLIVAGLFFGIILYKVLSLNIFKGESYKFIALYNSGDTIMERAPRGIIYDRYGNELLKNNPTFIARINLAEILKDRETIKDKLSELVSVIDVNTEGLFNEIINSDLERQSSILFAEDLSVEQVANLENLNSKWIVIENSYPRDYIYGPAFSHILGYTGLATLEDIKKKDNIDINDEVGKEGLEFYYDDELRGQKGISLVFKDAKGNIIETKEEKSSVSGNNIYTTIDKDLQEYFYNAFKAQLSRLNRTSGAGIILNPNTGEVLALISLPSYDNNNLESSIFIDEDKPTFNRAVSGLYSPGSTIKPLVGVGVLNENIISPNKQIYSPGYIYVENPYDPDRPSKFVDWRPQGWVDIYSALAKSSNVYFYEVGGGYKDQEGLGIWRLKEYWKKFLLDKKTGIDLPGEGVGFLPDPDWKEDKVGDIWRLGDTYNVSIGQGDLMTTPIELITYIASIADKGYLPSPFIAGKITDINDDVKFIKSPEFQEVDIDDKEAFSIVEEGMLDGVRMSYGTSYILYDLPIKIAAKTGSSQTSNNQKTNAFFVGYNIPTNNNQKKDIENIKDGDIDYVPQQIAILVLIEDAKEGSLNAVPIARDVFKWYYENRLTN